MDMLLVMKVGNGYLVVPTTKETQPNHIDMTDAIVATRIKPDFRDAHTVTDILESHFNKPEAA